MKIAYIASPKLFSRGASSIEVIRMAQALAKAGYDVELIIPRNSQHTGLDNYYGIKPIFKLKYLPSAPGLSLRHVTHGLLASLYTFTKRPEYDLVFSRNILYALISARIFKIPTIFDAHHPIDNPGSLATFNLLKGSSQLLRFVAISEGIGSMCLELGLPAEKLTIAPNGFDPENLKLNISKLEARKKLSLPAGRTIISHIGNIYSGRGIEHLIEASLELPEVLFLIVGGEDGDINYYKNICAQKGVENVAFTGFIPPGEVSMYFKATDFLILPYTTQMTTKWGRVETNFASLLKMSEYMASGRPIIATDIPAISSALRNGENAILVRPDSTPEIVSGIRSAMGNGKLSAAISREASIDSNNFSLDKRISTIFADTGFELRVAEDLQDAV